MVLAIFTKYPIIHKEGKQFANSANGYLMVDLVIKEDTVRVINLQLWSMGIRVGKVTGKIRDQDYEDAKKEGRGIIASMRKGFIHHRDEMNQINRLIQQSQFPVIVVGDLNETPYGWAYGTIRERLKNSFEESEIPNCQGKVIGTNVPQGGVVSTGDNLIFIVANSQDES